MKTKKGYSQAIFDKIVSHRNLPFNSLKNETIAREVGCSVRTVQRWTTYFDKKGIIAKFQNNMWRPNHYKVQLSNKKLFNHFLGTLSDEKRDEFLLTKCSHHLNDPDVFNPPTVIPSYLNINLIFIYNYSHNAHARVVRIQKNRMGWICKDKKRRKQLREGVRMLYEERKEWLRKNHTQPTVSELLHSDRIKKFIYTEGMQELTQLLELDEREQLKLVAFPEEALQSAIKTIRYIQEGHTHQKRAIKDRMAYLISLLKQFCRLNAIEPDWKWYFDLCDILQIQAIKHKEVAKPLKVEIVKHEKKNIGYSPYDEWRGWGEDVGDVRIEKIKNDIVNYKKILADPSEHLPASRTFPEVIDYTRNALAAAVNELMLLSNEKTIH